jgi:hypothetical protein
MTAQPGSDGGRDFVTIFKTGSVDRDDYPELAVVLTLASIPPDGEGLEPRFGGRRIDVTERI